MHGKENRVSKKSIYVYEFLLREDQKFNLVVTLWYQGRKINCVFPYLFKNQKAINQKKGAGKLLVEEKGFRV